MKQLFVLSLIILWSCLGKIKTDLETLNVKGKVEYISEKRIPSTLIEGWETIPDSNGSFSISNSYFDKNGFLTKIELYDKDSVLIVKGVIEKSKNGKYQGTKTFNKNGELIEQEKVISETKNSMETETYDIKSGDLLSTFKIEYENHLIKKTQAKFFKEKLENEQIFKRDKNGNEIEISSKIILKDEKTEHKNFVKYIAFDKHKNWTKRISYTKGEKECILNLRQIKYYE